MRTRNIITTFVLAAGLLGAGWNAPAQDAKNEAKNPDDAKETKKAEGEKKVPAKDKEAKKPVVIAITGADVYTVTRGVIRGATIVVKDGKIQAVGQDVEIPAGATRIDAAGKVVTPGFVSISASNLGMRAAGGPGGGGGPGGQPKFADSLNPYDRNMLFCLASGITTACVEVGGGGGGRFGRDSDGNEIDLFDIPDDT